MTLRGCWIVLLVLFAPLAQAASPSTGSGQAVHAFLDRNHVSLGDTVTLNIQSNDSVGTPDLSPLQKDFEVLGTSRSSSMQIVNGKRTSTSRLGIALKPKHAGALTIPALDVGGGSTRPLTLQVGAAPSGGTGKIGDPVFMEATVLSSSPWVGQQTVYTVRLYYLPGVDGALGDPSVDGARLIQLDRDRRYVTQRDGYTYKVIERSWALIPQRSGSIRVRGPEFQGRQLGTTNPNTWFNDPNALLNAPLHGFGAPVHALAPTATIDARAAPANSGKPWLPARDVQVKLSGLPASGEVDASAPLTLTLSISASGVPADALPEPELPSIAGARVYPDQPRDSTDDSGQWLHGTRTRSFAIVPDRNGALTIPAITLDWWNVEQNRVEQATVPAHTLKVSGVAPGTATPVAPPAPSVQPGGTTAAAASANPVEDKAAATPAGAKWRDVAMASFALWVLAIVAAGLWWWIRKRGRRVAGVDPNNAHRVGDRAMAPPGGATAETRRTGDATDVSAARVDPKALQRHALDAARAGDAAECERALLAWARAARPGIANAGALRDALDDPSQREALDALQRARWQGADAGLACAAMARDFAGGFAWRSDDKANGRDDPLPPLYPL
jgi:hypothetical protein